MKVSGTAVRFGDNVDTDVIIPGRYLVYTDPAKLGEHAMEGIDPDFNKKSVGGVVIVAGKNFGCGSSREQAPIALENSHVKCILADSFARIFFRNSINTGLPVLECKGARQKIEDGDLVTVELETGTIEVPSKGVVLEGTPMPQFILDILLDGGLVEHIKKRRSQR